MKKYELGAESLWVFVSSSQEPRHLHDIVFGVDVLRGRGVDDANILVFVDHLASQPHLAPFGISNVYQLSEIGKVLAQATAHPSVAVIVTGHGSETGLGNGKQVTPAGLCAAMRTVPGAALCVLVLGQCFAGIFNYLDAASEPPMVIVGATNLNLSLSFLIKLGQPVLQTNGSPGLTSWRANLFTFCFFSWIRSPIDIDGDGDVNLLDAYKFAGAVSNAQLRKIKAGLFREAGQQARALEQAEQQNAPVLVTEAMRTALQTMLETLYLHQEPWILHANLARRVHFSGFTK